MNKYMILRNKKKNIFCRFYIVVVGIVVVGVDVIFFELVVVYSVI